MPNIRAIFWDVDGTMVMSEEIHEAKMEHIAAGFGCVLDAQTKALFHGTGDRRAHEIMAGLGYAGTCDEFIEECLTYYQERLNQIEIRDGFMDAFERAERVGLAQAAVSNGIAPLVALNIERAGIAARLDAVVDLDYMLALGKSPKPAADPYREALRQVNAKLSTNIEPAECLVIEDSPAGVASGKAAGMKVIYWKLSPHLTLPQADFEAFSAADLQAILALLVPNAVAN